LLQTRCGNRCGDPDRRQRARVRCAIAGVARARCHGKGRRGQGPYRGAARQAEQRIRDLQRDGAGNSGRSRHGHSWEATSDRAPVREPVLITVQVSDAFVNLSRSASPVIVVNGQPLNDTIVPFKEPNRLVAVLRDGTRLDQTLRVQVGWLGDLERTLSDPVQAQLTK
jgi:hypothetical protein